MTRTARAFTLIELLVVIAIIAVLMAILMPALQRVKDQARDQACRGNLKGIGLGILMYHQDNDYMMPDTGNSNSYLWYDDAGNPLEPRGNNSYWGIAYLDYVKERELFGCPAFRTFAETIAKELLYGIEPELIYTSAYAANGSLSKENTIRIPRHSEVLMAHDHMEPRIDQDMLFPNASGMNLNHYRQGGGRSNWYRGIFRHNIRSLDDFKTAGTLNILWLDGHVTSLRETDGEDILKRWYDPLDKH